MSPDQFKNKYDSFSSEKANKIFNKNNNEISEYLQKKMIDFKNIKLDVLQNEMEDNIFYDGTVYVGSTGIALYFFNRARHSHDYKQILLKTAWTYINLSKLKGRRISFLCGDAGPLALAAVISYKLGKDKPDDLPDYKVLIQRLMSLEVLLTESPDEILYGKSGYLYSLLFVNQYIGKQVISISHIQKVINAIIHSGQELSTQMKSRSPLLWEWHDKVYLGAAHGMAGILYLLLQAKQYVDSASMQNIIKPTIDWLIGLQFSSGNFPSSYNSSSGDRLVQWCHGAPGFVPLLLLAHQIFEEEKYLNVAIKCGDSVWERGLCTKGYSLCHGVGGNIYTFVQLYQTTKDPMHLYRAYCFLEWCVAERPQTELHHPDRPASLFEGLAGRLYILEELNHIMEAKFPAFTV